ncbi:hypothetical protein GCM10027594_01380 [Hymenobacter agri]
MVKKYALQSPEYHGLVAICEPAVRKTTAAKYKLPSGALLVLISVAAMSNLGRSHLISDVYSLNIARQNLVRSYLAVLSKAGLVHRYTSLRCRRVRLTLEGMGVAGHYHRDLRNAVKALIN